MKRLPILGLLTSVIIFLTLLQGAIHSAAAKESSLPTMELTPGPDVDRLIDVSLSVQDDEEVVILDRLQDEILVFNRTTGLLVSKSEDDVRVVGSGIWFARYLPDKNIIAVRNDLSLVKIAPSGGESTLLPEKSANAPIFISRDGSKAAYVKPGDFEGGSTPYTNGVAVYDFTTGEESVLFSLPYATIHLYGWLGDSLIVDMPYWDPVTMQPSTVKYLGLISSEVKSSSIRVLAELPALAPGARHPNVSLDQKWLTYESLEGAIIVDLARRRYAQITDQSEGKLFSQSILSVDDLSSMVDQNIQWRPFSKISTWAPLPSITRPNTELPTKNSHLSNSPNATTATLLYRPAADSVPISYYMDLDSRSNYMKTWTGWTGSGSLGPYGTTYDGHEGTDYDGINYAPWTPVYPAEKGTVGTIFIECAEHSPSKGYGTNFRITHGTLSDGNSYATGYAHLRCNTVGVTQGQKITTLGIKIAEQGNTGNTSGTGSNEGHHLHLNVHRNNSLVDPYQLGIMGGAYTGGGDKTCDDVNYNGIILYEGKNCNGNSKSYNYETSWIDISDFNDKANSIYVKQGEWSVRVYEHSKNQENGGKSRCITWSMWDLTKDTFDNSSTTIGGKISSIQVFKNANCSSSGSGKVILYRQNDYKEEYFSMGTGTSNKPDGVTNSMKIPSGWIVWTYKKDNKGGDKRCWNANTKKLQDYGWQNIESIEVFSSGACPPSSPKLDQPPDNHFFNRGDNIKLSWKTASYANSYYARLTGGPNIDNTRDWSSSTSWTIGQLWGGTYQWRVKARNHVGTESNYSSTWTFTVKYGSPTNLKASAASPTQINLSWGPSLDAPSNIDGYRIYRSGIQIATVGVSAISYQSAGLDCATSYSYTVKAYKGSVESDASNTATAGTQGCPTAPTANFDAWPLSGQAPLTVDFHNTSQGSYTTCMWDYGDGWTSTICGDSGGYHKHIYTTPGTYTPSLTVVGPGGTHWKTIQDYITVAPPPPPMPTSLTIDPKNSPNYTVRWTPAPNTVSLYELQERFNGGSWSKIYDGVLTARSFTGKGQGTWCYRVRAGVSDSFSGWTNDECTVISPSETVGVPAPQTPANGATLNRQTNVNLGWQSVQNATAYYVELKGGPNISINSGWQSGTSWQIGQMWGGTYEWRVKARSSSGTESSWSNWATFYVHYGGPTNLDATFLSEDTVLLTWDPSADAPGNIDGYIIYHEDDPVDTVDSWTTDYTIGPLYCGSKFYFSVFAYKGSMMSDDAGSITVSTPPCANSPQTDIFWYAPGTGRDTLALSKGDGTFRSVGHTINGSYMTLIGDFDGDGIDDIFWYAPGTASDTLAVSIGNGTFYSIGQTINGTYTPLIGDFNGDGADDIFWYAPGSDRDTLALSNRNGTFYSIGQIVNGTYTPLIGDFNGDGTDDIFWYAPGSGRDTLALSNGNGTFYSIGYTINGTYTPLIGDFNGDGIDDIFWYAPGSGKDTLALSNGNGTFYSIGQSINGTYTPLIGDFNGDGIDDIFWYAPGTARDTLALSNGNGTFHSIGQSINGNYTPLIGDYNGDGIDDIFWYAPGTDRDTLALSNGNGTYHSIGHTVNGWYTPLIGHFD